MVLARGEIFVVWIETSLHSAKVCSAVILPSVSTETFSELHWLLPKWADEKLGSAVGKTLLRMPESVPAKTLRQNISTLQKELERSIEKLQPSA